MSYDLHITRKEHWANAKGPIITAEEWLAIVLTDPELRLQDEESEPYFAVWDGPGEYECWIDYDPDNGDLYSKEPTDEFFNKMLKIATLLEAKVQGDDGEIYGADGSVEKQSNAVLVLSNKEDMGYEDMKYIVFIPEVEETVLRSHTLRRTSEAYLRNSVIPALLPLSDEEYITGPAKILSTAARFVYVLDTNCVYWCIECIPGLVVVKFSPDGSLAWAKLASPNPEFGGREATEEELANYDEDQENPQYNLVFDAWDAQFEPEELKEWEVVDAETESRFNTALAHVQKLGEIMAEQFREQGSS